MSEFPGDNRQENLDVAKKRSGRLISGKEVRALLKEDADRPRIGLLTVMLLGVLLFVTIVKFAAIHGILLMPHVVGDYLAEVVYQMLKSAMG
jgi:hypothetical protein